jgi:hypothetical protein
LKFIQPNSLIKKYVQEQREAINKISCTVSNWGTYSQLDIYVWIVMIYTLFKASFIKHLQCN